MNKFNDMPNLRGGQENPPRNLKTHPEETIATLVKIEGDSWNRQQQGWDEYNIAGALAWLESGKKDLGYIIYGAGGMNRYRVDATGNVALLKYSSSSEFVKLAEQEGFKIV